ncbi:MAG: hypothetical protein KJ607_03505, partial [Bacteroidetes bacterium]|nr:hypothetical protein [Bacteroidota bacterium]
SVARFRVSAGNVQGFTELISHARYTRFENLNITNTGKITVYSSAGMTNLPSRFSASPHCHDWQHNSMIPINLINEPEKFNIKMNYDII